MLSLKKKNLNENRLLEPVRLLWTFLLLLVVKPVCSVVRWLKCDVVPGNNLKKLWELLEQGKNGLIYIVLSASVYCAFKQPKGFIWELSSDVPALACASILVINCSFFQLWVVPQLPWSLTLCKICFGLHVGMLPQPVLCPVICKLLVLWWW